VLETLEFDALAKLVRGDLPDTALVRAAVVHAQAVSEPWLFHHVMRSWLFATHVAHDRGQSHDAEVVAIGAILHDIGLTPGHGSDDRFEVGGANAAWRLIDRFAPSLDSRRRQLVWDSIALHSTGSIARHKEPEVALVNAGIGMDYGGAGLDRIAPADLDVILAAFPRLGMKERFCSCLCELASEKPASTYGTWVADFGLRFVDGYAPPSSVDSLFASSFLE
jgi:hypothetical protein